MERCETCSITRCTSTRCTSTSSLLSSPPPPSSPLLLLLHQVHRLTTPVEELLVENEAGVEYAVLDIYQYVYRSVPSIPLTPETS